MELFPDHPDAKSWRNAIRLYTGDYLAAMSRRNSFGIVPYGFHRKEDPGNRKIGNYWYRYFMRPENWWVGVNANLASAGVGLVRAAKFLMNRRFERSPSGNSTGCSAATRSTPARS